MNEKKPPEGGIKILEELDGHMAYELGSTDSGVYDPARKNELLAAWYALSEVEQRQAFTRFAADWPDEYGMSDIYEWCDWLMEQPGGLANSESTDPNPDADPTDR